MTGYEEAASAIRRFGRVMEDMVHNAVAELAPPGRTIVEVAWGTTTCGFTTLTVTLDNGDVIRGTGEAKLEALGNAQLRRLVDS